MAKRADVITANPSVRSQMEAEQSMVIVNLNCSEIAPPKVSVSSIAPDVPMMENGSVADAKRITPQHIRERNSWNRIYVMEYEKWSESIARRLCGYVGTTAKLMLKQYLQVWRHERWVHCDTYTSIL